MFFPSTRSVILAGSLAATSGFASTNAAWVGWGTVVGEPGLDAAIELALDQSAPVSASRIAARVRVLETRLARADRHPQIDLGATWRAGREDTASTGFEEEDIAPWDLGGTARLDLDVFGALRSRTRGFLEAEQVAGFELRARELDWAADLARLLVQLRYLEAETEFREAVVDSRRIMRDWARGREAAGLVSGADLDTYETRLLQARREQVETSERMQVLQARWQYLAATHQLPVAATNAPAMVSALPTPDRLPGQALERPEVQAAQAAWQRAAYHAEATGKTRLPTLSAVATARGEGPSPVQDPDEWTAWAGLQLAIPLWAPDNKARSDRDREQVGVEEALYQDAIRSALRELQQAYARCWHVHQAWSLATEEAEHLRSRLDTAQRKYDQGLIMRADLERTRSRWLEAVDRGRRAHATLLAHQVDLVRAGGGPGW